MAREAQGGLDRLGLGAWGAVLVLSGTSLGLFTRSTAAKRDMGRGEAGRTWQRHHHQRSGHRYLASPIPRLPSLAAEIGIAGHRKVSTRGLSLDGEHTGTSISTTGGGEAGGRDKQHPAHTRTQQSAREGSCDCLDGLWPFAVTAFTRNPYATPTLTQKLSRLADEAIPSSGPEESQSPVDSSWSHIWTPNSRPRPSPIYGSPPLTVAG